MKQIVVLFLLLAGLARADGAPMRVFPTDAQLAGACTAAYAAPDRGPDATEFARLDESGTVAIQSPLGSVFATCSAAARLHEDRPDLAALRPKSGTVTVFVSADAAELSDATLTYALLVSRNDTGEEVERLEPAWDDEGDLAFWHTECSESCRWVGVNHYSFKFTHASPLLRSLRAGDGLFVVWGTAAGDQEPLKVASLVGR